MKQPSQVTWDYVMMKFCRLKMRKEAVLRQIALEDRLIADAERCIASQLDRVEESTSSERPRLVRRDTRPQL